MKYARIWLIIVACLLILAGCGMSYEETKRLKQEQQRQAMREDSAALKVAVMPTLDCLPFFVAKEREMFDTAVDIRLKTFTAQMDCDTALQRGRVELAVSDLVRTERMASQGLKVKYLSATNAYWLLIGNRNQRITDIKHLDDRMVAMTRYSVTDLMAELAVDSAKLKPERVFRIQVNDVNVRLDMLENNEMDALLLTEPQATQALLGKHHVLLDSRKLDMWMGVIAEDSVAITGENRQRQLRALVDGYNKACDSLNAYGVKHYRDVMMKYCDISEQAFRQLPDSLHYDHAAKPRKKDVERARQWLGKK
jgi:NitT/TauT family transport system substrate-binding protein